MARATATSTSSGAVSFGRLATVSSMIRSTTFLVGFVRLDGFLNRLISSLTTMSYGLSSPLNSCSHTTFSVLMMDSSGSRFARFSRCSAGPVNSSYSRTLVCSQFSISSGQVSSATSFGATIRTWFTWKVSSRCRIAVSAETVLPIPMPRPSIAAGLSMMYWAATCWMPRSCSYLSMGHLQNAEGCQWIVNYVDLNPSCTQAVDLAGLPLTSALPDTLELD